MRGHSFYDVADLDAWVESAEKTAITFDKRYPMNNPLHELALVILPTLLKVFNQGEESAENHQN